MPFTVPSKSRRGRKQTSRPFLRWAGSKKILLGSLLPLAPANFNRYHEPFLGSGALFFALRPKVSILSDSNPELIDCYLALRDHLESLIRSLSLHTYSKEYFYAVRAQDPNTLSPIERASRMIYLNRTCYNALYRVNKKGKFNTPFGHHAKPVLCDEERLREASGALQSAEIRCHSFERTAETAAPDDFIYFDPPYYPLSKSSDFKRYTARPFTEADHIRLAELFRSLDRRGCRIMLSNSDHDFIRKLYRDYRIETISACRRINSAVSRRHSVSELVILNY